MVACLSSKVQYAYVDGSTNTIRRTEVTYPDSSSNRKVTLDYGTSGEANDRLSRVATLRFTATDVALYKYLGLATPVQVDYAEPDVRWDLITGSGANPYAGLDRFGRVIDNLWYKYSSPTADVDRIKHGYDRASNRLWRENTVSKGLTPAKYFDELYSYDGLNRLKNMERGQLSGSPPSSITNLKFEQDWGLDPTGNWGTFKEDSDGGGTWDINQTRSASEVNEITGITSTPTWITPGYDANGNMTTMPQPATPGSSYTAVYDAWNRLVRLSDGANKVQENAYDGLTRRTLKLKYDPPGTLAETRHYYYSDAWQILEERVGSGTSFDRQFVWGLRYIDDIVLRDRTTGGSLERLYACQDPNWNVTAILNTSAAVQERYAYSAYGTPVFLDANFAARAPNVSSHSWDTLFAGYLYDPHTGLYLSGYRFLHHLIGAFIIADWLGGSSEESRYEYVNSRPIIATDPTGLFSRLTDDSPNNEEPCPCSDRDYGRWKPEMCNESKPCKCKDTKGGKNLGPLPRIEDVANDMRMAMGIECVVHTVMGDCGAGDISFTCSRGTQRGKRDIYICISETYNYCDTIALLKHELVHAQQFCNMRSGQQGQIPPGQCEAFETPAWTKQCEVWAEQECCEQLKTAAECKQQIDDCAKRGVKEVSCNPDIRSTFQPCTDDNLDRIFKSRRRQRRR